MLGDKREKLDLQNQMFKTQILDGSPFMKSQGMARVALTHSVFALAGRGQNTARHSNPFGQNFL